MGLIVTCAFCNKEIIETNYKTKSKKRYHNQCYFELLSKTEKKETQKINTINNNDKQSLCKYIRTIYRIDKVSYIIDKQIEDFITNLGYTYSGIQGTLYYFYEINENTTEGQKTIGIVPYYYDEAQEFFKRIEEANEINSAFSIQEKTNNIKVKPKKSSISYIIDLEKID